MKKRKNNYQIIFEDRGYNSGVSESRGKNRKVKKYIPPGVSIPDCSFHEGEEVFTYRIFRLLSKYILLICRSIWEEIPEERIEQFENAMVNVNITESLQMCIYRFDIGADAITNAYLCEDHIVKKNNQKFLRVAVFSTMIWDSAIDYGKKGWRVAVICYTGKSISDYYK